MICPVPCADCGRMVPLSKVQFVYEPGQTRSERGLCSRCWLEHIDAQERDDQDEQEWDA